MNTEHEAVVLELNKPIELAKTLQRLFDNKDFQDLYSAYTKDFLLSTTINLGRTTPANRPILHDKIDGIANFIRFTDEIMTDGNMAAEHLANMMNPEEEENPDVD